MYSQNEEEKHILDYFKDKSIGTVLDIGANDGKTFSNSLALIEKGWRAFLVEPSIECCKKLHDLHKDNEVSILKVAIGTETKKQTFYESGELKDKGVPTGNTSLVSTLIPEEKIRWQPLNMPWIECVVDVVNWEDFMALVETDNLQNKIKAGLKARFDFISIDAEGVDWEILSQIDLTKTETSLVCIEHNGNKEMVKNIVQHCHKFGVNNLIYTSGENIILGR